MPARIRVAVLGSLLAAVLAVAAQLTGLAATGSLRLWAVNLGWMFGGVAALTGSVAAALRVERGSAVWRAWTLYAVGSACWIAGALIRIVVTHGSLSPVTASLWLIFALCGIASFAARLPRLSIFGIFLLDAIPVVLLLLTIVRAVEPAPAGISAENTAFLNLYPVLYVLLAANAIQMAGIHWTLQRVPPSVWLFTPGFCVMALAALIWVPAAIRSGSPQGHLADTLWTLGLLGIAAAGLTRALEPTGAVTLPQVELARGPHALPAATAVLGLIVMLTVIAPADRLLVLFFLLAAALDLFVRVYLLRRQDLRLLARLGSQNERLRELDRMKDEFVGLVSHELRTPLTSIVGYLELIQDEAAGPLTPRQREFTGIIRRGSDRLLRLVGDLLFLSRIQAGKLTMEFGETDLLELARLAVQAARPAADSKDISLRLSAGPVPHLTADRMRVAQLLDNLLSNAIKFTPRGGQVTVCVGTENQRAALDVTDTGLGISAPEREQVFDRFFRAENAIGQAIQGSGLGLTITKAIVDAHGGAISLSSELGRGTTFRVRLPLGTPTSGPPSELPRPNCDRLP